MTQQGKQVSVEAVIAEYRRLVAELQHEAIMLRCLVAELQDKGTDSVKD